MTSVPVRSSLRRLLALDDKSSNRPVTRVRRSWSHPNSVWFAKTSNDPETFVSSRSRICNFGSFEISRCSAPPRSRRPGSSIIVTAQPSSQCLGVGRTSEPNQKSGHNNIWDAQGLFVTNFLSRKILDQFFSFILVALPKGPCDTRKFARVPLQL